MKFRLKRRTYRLKNFYPIISIFFILLFLEVVFRLFTNSFSFNISLILANIFASILLSIFCNLSNKFINRGVFTCLIFLITLIYVINFCLYQMFGLYFEWSLIGASNQVLAFASDGLRLILTNVLGIIILFIPFVLTLVFRNRVSIEKDNIKKFLVRLGSGLLIFIIFILSLNINKNDDYSNYKLYYKTNNIELNIKHFGVVEAFFIDTKRNILGFSEEVKIIASEEEKKEDQIIYSYNNLDINFDKLISKESNNSIKLLHEYFKNESGSKKNEYTKFFEGKNLILFMAESFNEIAVKKELTPTLYNLVNNGFVFKNFYTPTISSTIGGEFQELTGLIAASGFLGPWKSGNNSYPFGIATVFKNMGYNTFAYHDHNYTFQNRNKYLKALGFDNYKGCRNGLEKQINCKIWPESDVEMMKATIDDYIDSEKPFFTYYATVSGHGDYSFKMSAMAKKHKNDVSGLNYSEKPLSYLAAQMELDQALNLLIERLEEKGILDNTVIALVGDHYPYYMNIDEVNEISDTKKDSVVEVNRSNFILWNNNMESVNIDKVGSQIDVLPTIYNLFGVSYDSRLIVGKDILSDYPGLAIFANRSWVSDKGTYFANQKRFVPKDGVEVSDTYVEEINDLVSNRVTISKNIMTTNYYKKVLGD